jgi:ATP-binding cassette, subfamily B, bacterial HlyB/CyaB
MKPRAGVGPGLVSFGWFGLTLWRYTPVYIELAFLALCLRLIGLVEPFVFQVIIDRILPFQRQASLIVVMAIFTGVSLFQIGFEVLSEILGMLAANAVTQEFGRRIFSHLFRLPFAEFRRWPVGEFIARIGETDAIHSFLAGTTTGVLLDLLFLMVYLGILASLSWPLTLIVLAALPLQFLIYAGFGPFLRGRLRAQFDAGAAHQTQMVENISGIAAVKALSAEEAMIGRLDGTLYRALTAGYRVGLLNLWNGKLLFVLNRAVTIGIIFFGAQKVFAGSLTLGELIAFHLIAEKVANPISRFSGLWQGWQNIQVSRQRLADILNVAIEPFDTLPRLPPDIRADLRFFGVAFAYSPDTPILNAFDFTAAAGTLTLIVGPSGIGKSTFGRLAAGIEHPDRGQILLGGADIAAHDPHDVRRHIAYVPQEPYLFSGTLRENLTVAASGVDDAEILRALQVVAADRLLAQLPKGLDTPVGERGSALSGGQRQRVAIARSLLLRPAVLILDEPTSALDADAQHRMAAELQSLKSRVTLIVITHNPTLFPGADQVVDFASLARPEVA